MPMENLNYYRYWLDTSEKLYWYCCGSRTFFLSKIQIWIIGCTQKTILSATYDPEFLLK
eukprot:SAG11_NODE_25390_length_359_cov_0.992308_1_plen_58_part_01